MPASPTLDCGGPSLDARRSLDRDILFHAVWNETLLYVAAAATALWGIAHLVPTRSVVREFGQLSADNARIITMEWILEGVALIFIGVLVATVTIVDATTVAARTVYVISAIGLLIFATVSFFTGFRVQFLPFRLCPFIFTASSVLILLGGLAG